jgi:ATP-dependent helicase HrpB
VRRLHPTRASTASRAVLFDEAHERNLDTDLALALCLDLQRRCGPS